LSLAANWANSRNPFSSEVIAGRMVDG